MQIRELLYYVWVFVVLVVLLVAPLLGVPALVVLGVAPIIIVAIVGIKAPRQLTSVIKALCRLGEAAFRLGRRR